MDQNQQMLDALNQLNRTNQRQLRYTQLLCVFTCLSAAAFVAVFFVIRQLLPLLPQVNALIGQMQGVLGSLQQVTDELAAQLTTVDLASMVENVDELVITGQQSLEQTMEKLNTMDFEKLNQAIADLAAVIEPVANFFNRLR